MTEDDALNIAVFVLHHTEEVSGLRAGEIVKAALDPYLRSFWVRNGINLPWGDKQDNASFSAQLSIKLRFHVNANPINSRIIDGSSAKWKLGRKAGPRLVAFAPSLRIPSTPQHLGLTGEYAVMSELLALNWNVAKPPFDNGVDLFATKKGEVRTVQVKTSKSSSLGDSIFTFTGSRESHYQYNTNNHYYILVFRMIAGSRWINTFYVCRSLEFDQILNSLGAFDSESKKWTLQVKRANSKFFINGSQEITCELDRLEDRFV